jgi:hypothetical protein
MHRAQAYLPQRRLSQETRPVSEGKATVKARLQSGQMPDIETLWNVSLGGVFLEMRDPLPFGAEVTLEFALDVDPRIVRCKGFVVWTTKTSPEKAPGKTGVSLRLAEIRIAEMRALAQAIGQNL